MKWVKWPLLAIAVLVPIAIAQRVYYIPRLPDPVAGYIRREFVEGTAQAWLIVPSVLVAIALASAVSILIMPVGFFRFPNKRWWFASATRRRRLVLIEINFCLWILAGVIVLGLVLTQAIIMSNSEGLHLLAGVAGLGFAVFALVRFGILFSRLIYGDELPEELS
jgi:hypothetical protein